MNGKTFISLLCALFFAGTVYLVLKFLNLAFALSLSLCSGILFFLLLFSYLFIHEKSQKKQYTVAEKSISSIIHCHINGNIKIEKFLRNANIYFTDEGVSIISLDKKPHMFMEVLHENITKYESDFLVKLTIHTKDNPLIQITSSEIKKVLPYLKDNDWNPIPMCK